MIPSIIQTKQIKSEVLAKQIEVYLANGGTIYKAKPGETSFKADYKKLRFSDKESFTSSEDNSQ